MDWYDNAKFKHSTVTCLPCQHWSSRTAIDRNETLWCSFGMQTANHNIYFGGDTGYCPVFKEIGQSHGPFDLSLIPIGAYEPNWFMKIQHVNPWEAVQISLDLKSKVSIGCHFATFPLTPEPILEPKELLEKHLIELQLPASHFVTMQHGQTKAWKF